MWVIIDDERTLGCDVIIRTPKAGKAILFRLHTLIECLCIDHDLGMAKETGYDVIKWALQENCCPGNIQIVSQNPVGRQNIANILRDNGYTSKDLINWSKNNVHTTQLPTNRI